MSVLMDQAIFDEGLLDVAVRIEKTRPLTAEERAELDAAMDEFAAEMKAMSRLHGNVVMSIAAFQEGLTRLTDDGTTTGQGPTADDH